MDKFGLKSVLVLIAVGIAIVSAILVTHDVDNAIYAVDAAVAVLGLSHFAKD